MSGVCLVWIVFAETGSALAVAILGTAALLAAILFSTLGGTLVDRYDRRRLMILADVARALALAAVVLVLLFRGFNLPVVVAAYGAIGAFSTLFNPAEQAIVPSLVPAADVADANGLVRSSRAITGFLGLAIGGVLIVTAGAVWGVAVNALTFIVSAVLLSGMRLAAPALPVGPGESRPSYFSDLRAGFRWLWDARGFFQLTISATFFNFSSTLIGAFLVVYATVLLHGSALLFASLLAAEVGGSAIGSLLVGYAGAARYAGKAWVIPYGIVSGFVALALALVPDPAVAIVTIFVLGSLGGFAGTAWLTAAQLLVPAEMQGRYFGIDSLGSIAILPAAQIGGALLIAGFGIQTTYLAAAILWVISGTIFLFPRALWRLGVAPDRASGVHHSEMPSGSPETLDVGWRR
ncbi:MAG: MFS transporter [Thermoplasmata archaeon]|nr:MFS transporter [Thermoplasmata archaeon]